MNVIWELLVQVAWNGGVTPYIGGDTESAYLSTMLAILLFWRSNTHVPFLL